MLPKGLPFLKVIKATRFLLRARRATPHQVESLLGRWQWFLLLRRPLFSVLNLVYFFVRSARDRGVEHKIQDVPADVLAEFRALVDLAPFVCANLGWHWCDSVSMSDVGRDGWGVVGARVPPSCVAPIGRPGLCGFNPEPIPEEVVRWPWQLWTKGRWKFPETQNSGESRAAVCASVRILRNRSIRKRKVLRLVDSQVFLGMAQKGRSSCPNLLVSARREASIALFGELRFATRWVPTCWNLADGPSRGVGRPCVGWDSARKA